MSDLIAAAVVQYRMAIGGLIDGVQSLGHAARPGLQDGSPWSGLLSLHARTGFVEPQSWLDPSLVQVFGPRGAVYLVPRGDLAVFTVGLIPADHEKRQAIYELAAAARPVLANGAMSQRDVLNALGPSTSARALRWASTSGQFLPRWDTRDTVLYAAQPSEGDHVDARRELCRRFYRYIGPATVQDLAWWLDTSVREARQLTDSLDEELVEVITPHGPMILTSDSQGSLDDVPPMRRIVVLPPDDPVINRRTTRPWLDDQAAQAIWPKAPPPGVVLIDGAFAGTWRRKRRQFTVKMNQPISSKDRNVLEESLAALPLPYEEPATIVIG